MKGSDRSGRPEANPDGEEPKERPKPKNVKSFDIDKRLLVGAWEKVRANNGAPGVDAVGIDVFQERWRDNLYKLWNRMSSGSYFPGPVRAVEIPKDHGAGVRLLGVPNTVDRVAQTAAAMLLEEKLEPIFHPDSYGYRPGRSAQQAVAACRRRCWEKDWVVDCDIRAFFDSVPHDLLLKAVAHHTDERWILLYVERWLKAPVQMTDGTVVPFDQWMDREHPVCPGCDHLMWPHRDHWFWPHVALSNGGVHRSMTCGLEPGPYGKEVEGGTVRGDSQGGSRRGRPVYP